MIFGNVKEKKGNPHWQKVPDQYISREGKYNSLKNTGWELKSL